MHIKFDNKKDKKKFLNVTKMQIVHSERGKRPKMAYHFFY